MKKDLKYIKDHLVKTCDLPEYIETNGGVDLKWNRDGEGAVCPCPMPDHLETQPSFHINRLDDVWVYHCFGCGKKGTIIDFCMDFHGIRNWYESINFLCKYYNVEDVDDLILQGMKNISKKVNTERQMENENILVSNQCRMLLRKSFEENKKWVGETYRRLNQALSKHDITTIDQINQEAFRRFKNGQRS